MSSMSAGRGLAEQSDVNPQTDRQTDMQNLPKQTAELDKGRCTVWRGIYHLYSNTQEHADKECFIFSLYDGPGKELIEFHLGEVERTG